jgi:hypothetical protein
MVPLSGPGSLEVQGNESVRKISKCSDGGVLVLVRPGLLGLVMVKSWLSN